MHAEPAEQKFGKKKFIGEKMSEFSHILPTFFSLRIGKMWLVV